jgi:GR25 family glycosyltransferase involved in LPS biosynthesis
MRTALPFAPASDPTPDVVGHTCVALRRRLQNVPTMELGFDGDCAQANGLELPVIAINLARRTDRWQALSQRMSAIGFTRLIRASAVEGAHLPDSQVAALLRRPVDATKGAPRSHFTLTPPAIGCFLSHLAVWRWVLDAGLPRVLVLEDDAVPAEHFSAARLRDIVAALAPEAGLVFLGCMIMGGLADSPRGSALARLYYFNGTFAYLITPAACRSLLPKLVPLYAHIDHQISRVLIEQRHAFRAYYTAPPFFEPDWSLRSDCYVPLSDDAAADRELAHLIDASRRALAGEGRPLLPARSAG